MFMFAAFVISPLFLATPEKRKKKMCERNQRPINYSGVFLYVHIIKTHTCRSVTKRFFAHSKRRVGVLLLVVQTDNTECTRSCADRHNTKNLLELQEGTLRRG